MSWRFVFKNDAFGLTLPDNWAEYDDDENTAAFINKTQWSGNLRITPFHWNEPDSGDIDRAAEFIRSEVEEHPLTEIVRLGSWYAAFQVKYTEDDDIIYYWVTGSGNNLFICSFTIDKRFAGTDENAKELKTVTEILDTLQVF